MWPRKKKMAKPGPEEPRRRDYPEYDVLGYESGDPREGGGRRNTAYGISASSRIHTAIFGLVGSGKSSILKLLILQNLRRGEGLLVVDPHGELARTVLSLIPRSRWDDVVYVNPASIYRYGRTIRINPLEVRNENERYIVVMTFVNALYKLYRDSWGPRLETVLRNAANALVETDGHNTLGDLSRMITDHSAREMILRAVASENVRHFWSEIFEKQYSKDAGSSAYNKMDKILATPAVAAMLDATSSSVRMDEIIRDKKIMIADLSSGASDDIAEFLGTIILTMYYVEAKRRIDAVANLEELRKNPFYVYVDEAHVFSNSAMSEMLRALRKFGVKMTIATQTINAYEKSFADEICGVCQTIVTGKCDYNTARAVHVGMAATIEELQELQNHTFAFSSAEGGVPISGVFKSRPIPAPGQAVNEWEEAAKHSLRRWGEAVSLKRYTRQTIVRSVPVSPMEAAILHTLYFARRDMTKEEIITAMQGVFAEAQPRDVMQALVNRLVREMRYVGEHMVKTDDGDGKIVSRYSLDDKAFQTYFSQAAAGRRAGSELHLKTIFKIVESQWRYGRYCKVDLGDEGQSLPDVLIVELATYKNAQGKSVKSPDRWDEKTALSVEVETDPTKHRDQILKNYEKNAEYNVGVWFIVFSQRHRDVVREVLEGAGVGGGEYDITVIELETARRAIVERTELDIDIPRLSMPLGGTLPEADAPAPAATGTGPRLQDLEYEVEKLIKAGGMSVNPKLLRKKIGGNVSERDLSEAVLGLVKKGRIRVETQQATRTVDKLDGAGPKTTYLRKKAAFEGRREPITDEGWARLRKEDLFPMLSTANMTGEQKDAMEKLLDAIRACDESGVDSETKVRAVKRLYQMGWHEMPDPNSLDSL